MNHDDFKQMLGIVLTNEPASMDAYEMFLNLNQTSKITREVVQYSLQHKTWTKEYFERAHVFEDTVAAVGITPETLDEIVRNLKEFQPVLSVQINVFKALADFTQNREPCSYDILDELMSNNIARHRSTSAFDLHIAYCRILTYDSRKIYMNCYNKANLTRNVDGLIDLMVLHRKKPDLRLQISVCEMLSTQGIYKDFMFAYRQRMVKFLLDQIANTHGNKALTSIKTLLEACKNGVWSHVRKDVVSYNGIDIILKYIRKDFTCKDSWKKKDENQEVGFHILLQLTRDPENVVEMVEKIFKTTILAKNVLFHFMSDDQKKSLHLAELQNNIHAYWMILDLIRPTFFELPRILEYHIEIVIDRIERDFESTQALLYLFGILICLLSNDKEKLYAAIMLKSKNIDPILRIYSMDHKKNQSLNEVMNEVVYKLYSASDSLEVRNKIIHSSRDLNFFDESTTTWVERFGTFSFDEPSETSSEDEEPDDWRSRMVPFYASNDDSDEDSNDTDHDTVSDRDSNDDSLSEFSAVSDNIVSSDSEDGAGHHFFRKGSECDDNDVNGDFSAESSMSEEMQDNEDSGSEDDARGSCYEDSGSEDKEDDTFCE